MHIAFSPLRTALHSTGQQQKENPFFSSRQYKNNCARKCVLRKKKITHLYTVGNFRIAGGHVTFVLENGILLFRSGCIPLTKPSVRKYTIFLEKRIP